MYVADMQFTKPRITAFCLVLTGLLASCSQEEPAKVEVTLPALPSINLDSMNPIVRDQFLRLQAELEKSPRDGQKNKEFARLLHAYWLSEPASAMYQRCTQLLPADLDCPYLHSQVLRKLGEDQKAIDILRSLQSNKARYPRAPILLSDGYRQLGQYDEAIALLRDFLRANPKIPEARYGLAQALIAKGEYDEARTHLLMLHENGNHYGVVHTSLATVFRQDKNQEQVAFHVAAAKQYADSTIPLQDSLLKSIQDLRGGDQQYAHQAFTLFNGGRFDEARKLYLKSLQINPDNANSHANLVAVYGALGKIANAEEHFDKSISLNSETALAYMNMGTAYMNHGKIEPARELYSHVLKLQPDHAMARARRAYCTLLLGIEVDPQEYRQALTDDPTLPLANFLLGYHFKEQNDCNAAIPYLEKSARADDGSTVVFFADLVSCYAAQERFDEARNTLRVGMDLARKYKNEGAIEALGLVENELPAQ